ncbi:hypothetical protein Pelo_5859 [Pelomyxa schiedti]|nr:hypothetical protein Pelo_5859 [Pelomyxa schiedti]
MTILCSRQLIPGFIVRYVEADYFWDSQCSVYVSIESCPTTCTQYNDYPSQRACYCGKDAGGNILIEYSQCYYELSIQLIVWDFWGGCCDSSKVEVHCWCLDLLTNHSVVDPVFVVPQKEGLWVVFIPMKMAAWKGHREVVKGQKHTSISNRSSEVPRTNTSISNPILVSSWLVYKVTMASSSSSASEANRQHIREMDDMLAGGAIMGRVGKVAGAIAVVPGFYGYALCVDNPK